MVCDNDVTKARQVTAATTTFTKENKVSSTSRLAGTDWLSARVFHFYEHLHVRNLARRFPT